MKALLRLQAVVLLRLLVRPAVWICLLALTGAVLLPAKDDVTLVLMYFVGAPLVLAGTLAAMLITLGVMDTARWSLPVRPAQVLRAHLLFWTLICAVPAVASVVAGGAEAAFAAVSCVLFGASVIAATPIYQRLAHVRDASDIVLAVVLTPLMFWLGWGGLILALDSNARGLAYLLILFCITVAASAWTFLSDQALPAAGATADLADGPTDAATPGPTSARAPAASVIRSAWPPPFTGALMIVLGFAYQLLLGPDGFPAVWIPIVFVGLANIGLSLWRWLIATPIDRGRAFRLLFLPVVLAVVCMAATRLLVLEGSSERTEFFDASGNDWTRTPDLLALQDVQRVDPITRVRGPGDAAFMASRVRDDLRARFGLQIPEDRIAATIRHSLPDPATSQWDAWLEATVAAMTEVHAELRDDIVAAVRMRAAVNVLAALLFSLLLFRVQLTGFRRSQIWTPLLLLSVSALPFLPVLVPKSAIARQVAFVRDGVYAAFQDSPPAVTALLFLAAAAGAALLWMNSARAFRRLDVTDLPPRLNRWGLPSGGN